MPHSKCASNLQSKGSGSLIRLNENGGKQHMMPCHHALAYIAAAGIGPPAGEKAYLFPPGDRAAASDEWVTKYVGGMRRA